jgi:glycosyltransferase involved in cell wall biosynthesis
VGANLAVFTPLELQARGGPSYSCGMLAQGIASPCLRVTIITPRASGLPVAPAKVVQILPLWARYQWVPFRLVQWLAKSKIDAAFLSHAVGLESQAHGAYIWPDALLNTIIELKRANITVFREMVNCHRGTAKIILDDAYKRLGAPSRHTITDESVVMERRVLEVVDYIFCANDMVEKSLLENGVPTTKILSSSYGWDPSRLYGSKKLLKPAKGITAVFVGNICVRKGAHLLLDYWAQCGVHGRLILAGAMEPIIKERCAHLLARDDVVVLNYVKDVGALYRSADIFVFPTLEEGGPQVTYEACGCGLPVVTTPMGAARIVRHNQEGYLLDPFDRAGWITAIRALAEDADRRLAMGAAALKRAQSFHWGTVARERRKQILDLISHRRSA